MESLEWKKTVDTFKKEIFKAKEDGDKERLNKLLAEFLVLKRKFKADFIQEDVTAMVKEAIHPETILEVASTYTAMRQSGSYHTGKCPFKNCDEPHESFTVSSDKGQFYCFNCHNGGRVEDLLEKLLDCAPECFCDVYKVFMEWAREELMKSFEPDGLKNVDEEVAAFFRKQFIKDQKNPENYKVWGLYPAGFKSTIAMVDFMESKGISKDRLVRAHIICLGKTGVYSPFEARMVYARTNESKEITGIEGFVYIKGDERFKQYSSI